MYTIALCDDLPEQIVAVQSMLDNYQGMRPGLAMQISAYPQASELVNELKAGRRFDLYLLDIVMPGMDGISLAKKIREVNTEANMIFLTHSPDFALDAYRVSAAQYITKPMKEADLFAALDKVIASHNRENERFFTLSVPGRTINLLHSSIVAVEYISRLLRFHLANGEAVDSKTIRLAFTQAVASLLQDERFLAVHQSFVINMAHVQELQSRNIVMTNGMEVPVPRPKYVMVKNAYLSYLAKSNG